MLHRVTELTEQNRRDRLLRGAFPNSQQPGLLLGVRIPQTHEHWFDVQRQQVETDTLVFTCTTKFRTTISQQKRLVSEATWLCANQPIRAAIHSYAAHLPTPPTAPATAPIGWNSWDYYFSTVALDDLIENLDAICTNPSLASTLKTIVLDMGWEHTWGEWESNYRFPGGAWAGHLL